MEHFLIGLLVGSSLALTGSGGALLAIPLLIYFFNLPFKVANFFSLIIVSLAALIGVVSDYKNVKFKKTLTIVFGSLLGSYLSLGLKSKLSDGFSLALLFMVCFLSLYFLWRPKKPADLKEEKEVSILNQLLIGAFLGILTTLTGLGGGVLLLPIFISVFGMDDHHAVATSLATIFLSSLISFFLQFSFQEIYPKYSDFIFIISGAVVANYLVKKSIQRLSKARTLGLRKISYSLIVIYTLVSISMKELL